MPGKPDVESVVARFLHAQSLAECSTTCRSTIEKICKYKKHEKIDKTIDDKGKEKAIEDEKQLIEAMKVFAKDLKEKINELQAKIRAKELKKISSTTPSSWLSL